jgi:hypothetical protein
MTFGEQLFAAFDARSNEIRRKLTRQECIEITDTVFKDAPHGRRKAPKTKEPTAKDIPPSPESVSAYSVEIGYPLHGKKWCDFYEAKGWIVGRTKMKDWKAAVRNWKTNRWGKGTVEARIAIKQDLSEPIGWRHLFPYSVHAQSQWTAIPYDSQKLIIEAAKNAASNPPISPSNDRG